MNFIIECPTDIVNGSQVTKEYRQILHGKVAGGAGSRNPEEYQRQKIIEGTNVSCPTTKTRINKRTNVMEDISHPMKKDNGYDYTENFDGLQIFDTKKIYVNLKSVVGKGGTQTRTLRDECYPFIEAQLNFLIKSSPDDIYFANIFDGDEASDNMSKFHYLCNLSEYFGVRGRVYVGDLQGYFGWLKTIVSSQ
jgi:hypothetical protein